MGEVGGYVGSEVRQWLIANDSTNHLCQFGRVFAGQLERRQVEAPADGIEHLEPLNFRQFVNVGHRDGFEFHPEFQTNLIKRQAADFVWGESVSVFSASSEDSEDCAPVPP